MRKVIGIGETILDIIFRNNQPEKAVPGGSVFNGMVSLGRCGIPALFISELGNDRVGRLIKDFMIENHISPEYIHFFDNGSSPVSLAFSDDRQNVSYQFYRDFPDKRLQFKFPEIQADDILILSSYFAVNPVLRKEIVRLLTYAEQQKAIIYYDLNFRKPHAGERLQLMPGFIENFEFSTIVRCSSEDLEVLFPGETVTEIYKTHLSPYCKYFIVTQGEKDILLKTETFEKTYPVESFVPVSTIGAGDNFNAGFIYAMMRDQVLRQDLLHLQEKQWDKLIESGKRFASAVCLTMENYVPKEVTKYN
ncbi:MAG: PfkB family carbohydrate kinase [Dysgonamonadaceae bacterium]|jgi:fructokinase|nr:PfkB family carbohydrate kinase [Dysgonamonadaceae bacterium]